jgi:transcriptional regulator with XRE-family HTH domain
MQGSELKAIREALGWSQRKFAAAIGMTQSYIGQMERDEKPIERRTELAARYLVLKGDEA